MGAFGGCGKNGDHSTKLPSLCFHQTTLDVRLWYAVKNTFVGTWGRVQLYEIIIYAKLYLTITYAKKLVGSFLPRGRAQQRNRPTTSTRPSMDGRTPWLQPVKFTYLSYELWDVMSMRLSMREMFFFFEKWQIPNNFADLIAVKPPSSLMSGIKMSALSTQVCRVNFPADSTIFPWLATRATTTSSCDHPAKMGHCLSTSSDDMTPSSLKT